MRNTHHSSARNKTLLFLIIFMMFLFMPFPTKSSIVYSADGRGEAFASLSGKKVTLDPGHGWNGDPGAAGSGLLEKDITLEIAKLVQPILENRGIEVTLTRTGDEPGFPLATAAQRVNQFQPDLVVSIHTNSSGGTGTESCYTKNKTNSSESQRLAGLLTAEVSQRLNLNNRGNFPEGDPSRCGGQKGFTKLYIHDMDPPAAIIETAFIDGPADNDVEKLKNQKPEFAAAIASAIFNYFESQETKGSSATTLVIDVSGSMDETWQGGRKIDSAKEAALKIISMVDTDNQVSGIRHRMGLVTFSTNAEIALTLTSSSQNVRDEVVGLQPLEQTNIGAGLESANAVMREADTDEERIMILLSDGMTNQGLSPDEILAGPVQDAVDMNTCIYTVGFGDAGNLDEQLLKSIAEASGCGEYYYATDITELEQVYIRIRHQSTGEVIGEFSGLIKQGEEKTAGNFDVDDYQEEMTFSLYWPGSKLDLKLIDPAGNTRDENDPDVTYVETDRMIYGLVQNPQSGNWEMVVIGEDVPEGELEYNAVVSSRQGVIPPPTTTPIPAPVVSTGSNPKGIGFVVIILVFVGGGLLVYLSNINKSTGVSSSARMSARLNVIAGPGSGKVIHLKSGENTIGSSSGNHIRIHDPSISPKQAVIQNTGRRWFIQKHRNAAMIYVNNQPTTAVELNHGDEIRMGNTRIRFYP